MFLSGKSSRRPLKFAGSWYDSNGERLAKQIDNFIAAVKDKVPSSVKPLAIIAPHAGYTYSGITAAAAYLSAANCGIKRVFLLGPSHYQGFYGAALSPCKTFATVFGDLQVDMSVVADLKLDEMFAERADTHLQEHSLELQLAFIRKILGDVKIVPVIFGRSDQLEARFMAHKLSQHLQDGDLVVVSSDFTHIGPRYSYMPFPAEDQEKLKKLDLEAFSYLEHPDLDQFLAFFDRTGDTICGVFAIAVLLALLPVDSRGALLDYRTSQDQITLDPADRSDNSVSYMAINFSSNQSWSESSAARRMSNEIALTSSEREILLEIARLALQFFVTTGRAAKLSDLNFQQQLSEKLITPHGVFITLYGPEHQLRGCIGYILPVKALYQAVIDNTVAAASRDPRFAPVQISELAGLEIEISVLTAPMQIASASEIRLGVDGIFLHVGGRQSVFLPKVASDYGWTLEQTMAQLSQKAGLDKNAWMHNSRIEVFQAETIRNE